MELASAYAILGLSQTNRCSTIYGLQLSEAPIKFFSLSECVASDFLVDRWVWSDLSTASLLLVPLTARILDTKRAEAELARDQDRASRLLPTRW